MAEHYCEEHQVKFFKTPKMKNYAHPIEGTDPTEWCNMPQEGDEFVAEVRKQVSDADVVVKDPRPKSARPIASGGKDVAIARAVALKAAIELASAGVIKLENVGSYARKYEEYLITGKSGG